MELSGNRIGGISPLRSGIWACCSRLLALSTVAGLPTSVPMPGCPKLMLYANSVQTMSVMANA